MGDPITSRFPRADLGTWPTPLDEPPRLAAALGGPRVLVKRDDVNGLGAGGNKLRKLEYLLGGAIADGADTVITFGGLQTNHGRQTAAACARLGLRCELVLTEQVARTGQHYEQSGNVALDRLYGARVHACPDEAATAATHQRLLAEAAADGRTAATLPVGGSNPLGVLGYVDAAAELLDQLGPAGADRVVVACGSGGTAAGLALGLGLAGWTGTLDLVCVSRVAEQAEVIVRDLVAGTAELLGVAVPELALRVLDGALGDGYGLPTPQVWSALRLFGTTAGIALDPVYTGKAAAALTDEIGAGRVGQDEAVVFVHTGGMPALYGYLPEWLDELP